MSKQLKHHTALIAGLVAVLMAGSAGWADEWGSLKGRFVVDGKAPEPPKLAALGNDPYCLEKKPTSQALIVSDSGALANAVVYLRLPRDPKNPRKEIEIDIHPDYEAELKEAVVLDNRGCEFHPHITLVRVGQPLMIKNSDPTGHNTNITVLRFNETIPPEGKQIAVREDGSLPMPIVCNIHPFMQGHLLSQKHPYMAVSDEDGAFEIKNLPAGKHEFIFWHEAPGFLRDLKVKSDKTNRQGRIELTVAAGETLDLGDLKVPARTLTVR